LTDIEGDPVSVQVFKGNTADTSTFVEQVHKVIEKFHVENVIMVGDRGMIKQPQIDQLPKSFFYVTAITKAQINVLIKNKIIKLKDFSEEVYEVQDNQIRYILKRNPIRAQEIEKNKEEKFLSLQKKLEEKNIYLKEHPKSNLKKALDELKGKAKNLHIDTWINIESIDRQIVLTKDLEKLKSESTLDGCYVLKTDILESKENTSKIIHERYKDLKNVEWAFRTMKTTHLEIRPYYVRRAVSTEGHVFVVMLAYKLIRYLTHAWSSLNITIEEGIHELSSIRGLTNEEKKYQTLPQLDERAKELIEKLDIELPQILPMRTCVVDTRKKLIKSC
jgi:transposase